MSMSPFHSIPVDEPSEIEEIVKVEVNEQHFTPLQYVYKTDETSDEDPSDEEKVFQQLPLRKQRVYNEMVEFQKGLRQLGMTGSLRYIIHTQQEQINPPCMKKSLKRRWLLKQPQPPMSKLKQPPLLWVQDEE